MTPRPKVVSDYFEFSVISLCKSWKRFLNCFLQFGFKNQNKKCKAQNTFIRFNASDVRKFCQTVKCRKTSKMENKKLKQFDF